MPGIISRKRVERSRKTEAARRTRPGPAWFPLLLGLATWTATTLLLHGLHPAQQLVLAVGQKPPNTIVAAVDFTCRDLAGTELNRQREQNAVPPVFTVNAVPLNEALRDLDKLFDRLAQMHTGPVAPAAAAQAKEIGNTLDLLGLTLPADDMPRLAKLSNPRAVADALKSILAAVWRRGLLSAAERESGLRGVARTGEILVETTDGRPARIARVESLPTPEEAAARAVASARDHPALTELPATCLVGLLGTRLAPNLVYEPALTDERRRAAADRVAVAAMSVRAGTTLIERGEPAAAQQVELLRAHNERLRTMMSPLDIALMQTGRAGLLALALLMAFGFLRLAAPDLLRRRNVVALFFTLSTLGLALVRLLLYLSGPGRSISPAWVDFLLPLAFAPLIGTLLCGGLFAIALGLWTSLAAAVMAGNSFTVFALGVAAAVASAYAARHVRKRSQVFRAGFWTGLAQIGVVLCLAVMLQQPAGILGAQATAAMCGSMAAALLALLVVPLLESAFGLTSDIRLLELSDPSHPLLQRLAVDAPGTYHHSLMVANLAQAAADEIGAHSLLVRVCAYFHDIGKLSKPDYFIENLRCQRNPHDDLTPNMSTLVIMSHVKEGVSLAQHHRLPAPIRQAIEQHHGTSLVSFFFHRAQQQSRQGELFDGDRPEVEERAFRYPGPRPHRREMAVLALADSVEAASRSMARSSPGRIESLVHEIVSRKLADGQLSDSDLTLAELEKIKRSFIFTLTSMLHGRVPYPHDEPGNPQPPAPEPDQPDGRPPPDRVADDTTLVIESSDTMG